MTLKEDIKSTVNSKKIYGLKGDKVELVSDHGKALIVKGKNGHCFPVSVEQVISKAGELQF